jgi:hypothetical protein
MNIGKMPIAGTLFLDWIKFLGGEIKAVEYDSWKDEILITLEHPEMPKIKEGEVIPLVCPEYTTDSQQGIVERATKRYPITDKNIYRQHRPKVTELDIEHVKTMWQSGEGMMQDPIIERR